MARIHGGLMEAYKGYYEDEMIGDHAFDDPNKVTEWCEAKIRADTPKRRLEVYLEWNGILGYTGTIWDISQGVVEV